ncbi:uncharacterized protein LOC116842060 isoform X2 [Odontomachus brunneus]|uniref:uncharacterized protein LOC116842060 isoform X2 n=1 Tax=Odontomachus brunneus TaxID=486640 RepID=UPI0013F269EA|nr:uncharacterized protein LOC116842060 isoform X2 [Odontomachus brunneus]
MPTKTELEDVRMIMLSLLVSRPGFTQLPVLDQDYYEYEGKRIPWRKFGFGSLLEFLQSMPEYFCFSEINGVRSVRAITDKSKHVNSLVERQKKTSKFTRPNRSLYRHPRMLRYRPKIPAEKLNDLVGYVRNHPNGVNINIVLSMLQSQLPYVTLTTYDIQEQLRELGHQLYLDCDTIRPVVRNCSVPRTKISERCMSPLVLEPPVDMSKPSCSNAMYTVPEECPDTMFTDEDGFVRPNSARCSRQPKTDERLISSLKERPNYEEMISYHDNVHHDNQEEMYSIDDNTDSMDLNMTENESNKLSNLISQKMQSRLQQLVQKYPDGIKCSELPDLYMKEFKVPLNYTELGFNSVCTFVSYLPDIFCLKRLDTNDDFIAYNADMILKKQEQDVTRNDDQRTSKSSTRETMSQTKLINIPKSRFEIHDIDNNNTQFPLELPPNVLMKFAPDDVVHCHEISQILVTDLQQSQESYLEVYLVEVFTPSFFWIHLRKNINHFELFMKNLGTFYDEYSERYAIPSLALQRNLNCACIYANVWHRAVIKTVKPDFRVTVLFIDYGTQKTYPPENLFYLTKQFSYLPAQAIPCALYNVKPYGGDRWKKSITDRFIDRINESVLAMTVVSIDSSKNSMLITLTDKSEAKEVCINDWLVEENLAQYGKMGDCVDMESLPKYVVNNLNRLPSYCFAEENPVINSYNNKCTTTEEFNESPKVSSGPNFAYRENNQQSRSVPPGFMPFNEHTDRFNTPTNRCYGYSSVGSNTSTKTPSLFTDLIEDVANSPFLDKNMKSSVTNLTLDILSSDVERQMFAQFMQENTTLQIELTNSFRHLLKFPPETKNTCLDYITLLFQFNNALRLLVKELNNQLESIIPNAFQSNENDAGLSSKTYNYNPSCESPMNQEITNSLRPPPSSTASSSTHSFGEYHNQYHHAAFPISDTKDLPHSSQHQVHNPHNSQLRTHAHNLGQLTNQVFVSSHQADANGPCIQSSFISSDSESLAFNRHGNIAKNTSALENISSGKTPSSSSDLRKGMMNSPFLDANSNPPVTNASFPTLPEILSNDAEKQTLAQLYIDKLLYQSVLNTITASHSNTANINPSSCHQSANEFANANMQHGNVYKNEERTKLKETNPFISHQNVEAQVERNVHNSYDMTNLALYLPNDNQQSYTPTVNKNTNTRAADYNYYGNNVRSESNVGLVSTEYKTYEDAKVNSDGNYTPKIIYEAGPVMYNLQKKPEEQQLPLQSATQLQGNIVNNVVNHVAPSSSSIDRSVLNDEGYTMRMIYNPSPVTNTQDHYQPDILPQRNLPETWTRARIQNNDPLQNYSKRSISTTICSPSSLLAHEEGNYEANKEFTSEDSYRTVEPCHTSPSNNSERAMIATNFWNSSPNNDEEGFSNYNTSLKISFLFKKIDSVDGVTILFHMNEGGWMLMHEFVGAFTKFSKSCLMTLLKATNVSIPFKEVHRFEYPTQFLQLDSYPLSVVRDSNNRITSLNLVSLQAALGLLLKLKLISREELDNAFKGNKMFTQSPILLNMWILISCFRNYS